MFCSGAPVRRVEKQSPAFPAHLDAVSQTERHGLINPADTVDTQLLDDDFLEDPRLFRSPDFIMRRNGYFFIHHESTPGDIIVPSGRLFKPQPDA
jgi:hypothetical protein